MPAWQLSCGGIIGGHTRKTVEQPPAEKWGRGEVCGNCVIDTNDCLAGILRFLRNYVKSYRLIIREYITATTGLLGPWEARGTIRSACSLGGVF